MRSSSQAVRLLAPPAGLVVLAGPTGSGKTDLLHALAADGEQTVDLEALACHRGSAFGGVGQGPQPSHRGFVRAVRSALVGIDPARPVWIEDEGPFIGRVGLPPELVGALATAPAVEVRTPPTARVTRIVAAYSAATTNELVVAIERSATRLGDACVSAARAAVLGGDRPAAVALILPAYDAAYEHRAERTPRRVLGVVDVS